MVSLVTEFDHQILLGVPLLCSKRLTALLQAYNSRINLSERKKRSNSRDEAATQLKLSLLFEPEINSFHWQWRFLPKVAIGNGD